MGKFLNRKGMTHACVILGWHFGDFWASKAHTFDPIIYCHVSIHYLKSKKKIKTWIFWKKETNQPSTTNLHPAAHRRQQIKTSFSFFSFSSVFLPFFICLITHNTLFVSPFPLLKQYKSQSKKKKPFIFTEQKKCFVVFDSWKWNYFLRYPER